MTSPPAGLDELFARIRARAADPERRTSVRPSQLSSSIAGLDASASLVAPADGLVPAAPAPDHPLPPGTA